MTRMIEAGFDTDRFVLRAGLKSGSFTRYLGIEGRQKAAVAAKGVEQRELSPALDLILSVVHVEQDASRHLVRVIRFFDASRWSFNGRLLAEI